MSLIASNGLEYADLTQRLLGQPLKNGRNAQIIFFTDAGYPQAEIEAFAKGYDRARGGANEKYNAGWYALNICRSQRNRAGASSPNQPSTSS